MSVYLLATLDTKGTEAAFVRDRLREARVAVTVVDCGCVDAATIEADISREEVFRAADTTIEEMQSQGERGVAVSAAARGAARIVRRALDDDLLLGVLALGGSAGTSIGTAAMQTLPIGVPKLMVSTLASGDVSHWVGAKDILMLNSVVDISGINRISRQVLSNAAFAMAGMVSGRAGSVSSLDRVGQTSEVIGSRSEPELKYEKDVEHVGDAFRGLTPPARHDEDRPLICASMFGVTTPCVQYASKILEDAGYEVLVFHATGGGGRAMESLIAEGLIAGVLDITTTELADELVGGILSAGPDRLTAAARHGIPQVVSVGATDMVNFGPRETVPERFADRTFHIHNATVTLMRTTEGECSAIGRDIREKLARAHGPVAVMLPMQGVSALDREGQPFCDANARQAIFDEVKRTEDADVVEIDAHINDVAFSTAAAHKLIELILASGERKLPETGRPG